MCWPRVRRPDRPRQGFEIHGLVAGPTTAPFACLPSILRRWTRVPLFWPMWFPSVSTVFWRTDAAYRRSRLPILCAASKLFCCNTDCWIRRWPPLREPNPPIVRKGTGDRSYSRAELRRIADAARSDLRAAAMRIRTNRMLLARYRDGHVEDPTRRLELLDFVDRHGDVPRTSRRSGRARTPVVAPWVTEGGFGKPEGHRGMGTPERCGSHCGCGAAGRDDGPEPVGHSAMPSGASSR